MKIKSNDIKTIIKNNLYMLDFIKKASPWFITMTILLSLTAFVDTISNTWLSKLVFDGMAQGTPYTDIMAVVLALLGVMLVSAVVRVLFRHIKTPVANERIKCYVRSALYEKTKSLDMYCFENANFYDKYTRALAEADTRAINVLSSLSAFSSSVVSLATLFSIIIYLDPVLIFFALAGAAVFTIITRRLVKLRYSFDYDKTLLDRKANYPQRIFYEPQYAKELKMDNMYSYFICSYKNIVSSLIEYIKDRRNKIALFEFLASFQMTLMQVLMILFLTWRVYHHIITIGDYAALLNSIFALMLQLNHLFDIIPRFYQNSLYAQNLIDITESVPEIESGRGIVLEKNVPVSICFHNVSFSYPGTDKPVLKNISMSFRAGEKHAIVGHNGAGKSTLIKLLVRLYDVTDGEILVNGVNIKEYNVFSLRACIASVFQDFQLYAVPLSDFVLSGRCEEEGERELVRRTLQNVGLWHKTEGKEKEMHSMLSREFDTNGLIMSGGENQKLALAKAFVKQSAVMILDEPSSALDPISEYELHNKMLEYASGKTVILISHRLSTTKEADVIYYIENGELAEQGNHEALMELDGKYARMFKVQAASYQLDDELGQARNEMRGFMKNR